MDARLVVFSFGFLKPRRLHFHCLGEQTAGPGPAELGGALPWLLFGSLRIFLSPNAEAAVELWAADRGSETVWGRLAKLRYANTSWEQLRAFFAPRRLLRLRSLGCLRKSAGLARGLGAARKGGPLHSIVAGPYVSVPYLDMTGAAMPIAAHAAKPLVLKLEQTSHLSGSGKRAAGTAR